MRPGLEVGSWHETSFEVEQSMCPHFDGVLVHPVCATWTLVHQMEVAGRKLLVDFLEPHEEGVGAHLTIDHRLSAPIGARVRVRAEATAVRQNRLGCHMTACCGDVLIAEGRFVQVVLPRERLAALFRRNRPDTES